MRFIMLFFCLIATGDQIKKERELLLVENQIYELYRDNFNDFLKIQDRYIVSLDIDKINLYFNNKGYNVFVENKESEIVFKTKYKGWFKESEKGYSFYLVANNDYK